MPRASVLAAAPRLPSVDSLVQLKRNWGVSVSAMLHRLHALELVDDLMYHALCCETASRGFFGSEPNSMPKEASALLPKALHAMRNQGITKPSLAKRLHIFADEVDSLMMGLVLTHLPGGCASNGSRPVGSKPVGNHLRLVPDISSQQKSDARTSKSKPAPNKSTVASQLPCSPPAQPIRRQSQPPRLRLLPTSTPIKSNVISHHGACSSSNSSKQAELGMEPT